MIAKEQVTEWFRSLQDEICSGLEELDGLGTFQEDIWYRDGGGGGRTRAISGTTIQKGCVNFSAIEGELPDSIASSFGVNKSRFFKTGVSVVLHPKNPHVPIIYLDLRYIETSSARHWFGGSLELIPHYIVPSDARVFHNTLKKVCDDYSDQAFEQYNKWADDYFFLKHRGETRGIGGIFFDRLEALNSDTKMTNWRFVKSVGNSFLPIYFKQILNNNHRPHGGICDSGGKMQQVEKMVILISPCIPLFTPDSGIKGLLKGSTWPVLLSTKIMSVLFESGCTPRSPSPSSNLMMTSIGN